MNKVYQIQITLNHSEPKIWRRILIPADLPLADFHKVIQSAMGWKNAHLHQFIKNNKYYSNKMEDDNFWDDTMNVDYQDMKVADLLVKEKDKIIYEYDFGDGWEHIIILEDIQQKEEALHPVCIDGKMNCPPEDCGGVWGYDEMLNILKDPKNPDYEGYKEWLGEDFDPEHFKLDEINKRLKMKNFGCYFFY